MHIVVIASSKKVLPAFIPGCPFAIQDVSSGAQTTSSCCPYTLWLLLCRFWACNGQKMCLNWTLVVHYKPKTCIPNMGHVFNLIFELDKVHDCLLVITVFFLTPSLFYNLKEKVAIQMQLKLHQTNMVKRSQSWMLFWLVPCMEIMAMACYLTPRCLSPFYLYSKLYLESWSNLLIHECDYKSNHWNQSLHAWCNQNQASSSDEITKLELNSCKMW